MSHFQQIGEQKLFFKLSLEFCDIDLSLFINAHGYDVDNLLDINIIANKSVLGKYSKQSMK